MEIIAINGSPRKHANTATLLKKYLEGAASVSGEITTRLVNLYELDYTGCISCLGCKMKKGNNYGKCVVKDGIYELLREVTLADAIAIGSPIYFGEITGQLRCFLERLLFPLYTYEASYRILTPKHYPVTMMYTMNVTEEMIGQIQYKEQWKRLEDIIERVFTKPELIYAYNTYQVANYDKYVLEIFSEPEKAAYRDKQFPVDCQTAYDNGKKTAESILQKR